MNQHNNLVMKMGRIRFLLVLICVLAGLWIAFAKFVVPPIIESAYRGESLPFLNNMIKAQHVNPISHYLQKWDRLALHYLLSGLGLGLLILVVSSPAFFRTISPAFFRRFVGEATPGSLGAIRMWTCAILLLTISWEDLASIALLPVELREPYALEYGVQYGVMRYFYSLPIGFESFVTSGTSLRAFQLLTELILFLGMIGWKTRVVIPLAAFCAFVLNGILVDYSFFWHQNLLPIYLLAVLSCTPCGDGWSVDRLWKVYQGRPVPAADRGSPTYGWSRYACWVVIAFPYVANGLGKLRDDGGLFWWNATNMRSILYYDTLTPREFDWALSLYLAPAPDILFAMLGLSALLTELSFGMVLFSRTARRILPVMAMMMHMGILLFQRILFLELILLQFVFFDFTRIRKMIGQRLAASRGRIQVLYDGFCPLCRRTVRLLACLDLFARLEFLDFRRLDLNNYNRTHKLNLTSEDLEEEMYVVSRGNAYRGFNGYRIIALALPAFWPLVPWLFLPGISWLGALAYKYVARNRLRLLSCHSHCQIDYVEGNELTGLTGAAAKNDFDRRFGYALAISCVAYMMLYSWYHGVEFYPLTSWQLYTGSNESGSITYRKVLARYESGVTLPARLEDTIGALALDNRYSPLLQKCFGQPSDIEICKEFLNTAGSVYNKKARPGGKITHYEIQRWTWDFRANPLDPQHGDLVERFVHQTN
jgi:predicted DCC family thiol-disulfide oxidoreductase YuxK